MLNSGKTDQSTKINLPQGCVRIYPDTILSGTIRVEDKDGKVMWQKANCFASDIAFAIEICAQGLYTDVFETV